MLRIYDTSLDVVRAVQPLLSAIGRSDPDLERQLRRAVTSVPLNIAEGSYSRGRNRNARYATATGSMREVLAGLEVAEILGYVTVPLELRDRIDFVIATLVSASRVVHNRHAS